MTARPPMLRTPLKRRDELNLLELQTLQLASEGRGFVETAATIERSPEYVKRLRGRAMQKLGAENFTQAVVIALRRGLIT